MGAERIQADKKEESREAAIVISHVNRVFPVAGGEFQALTDICAEVPSGVLTILKGRSGSGKTTLLNIVGALDLPTSGSVLIGGRDVCRLSDRARENLRRTQVGFVFQSVSLIPTMNAFQNVEFSLRLAGVKKGRRERVEECLKMVGLGSRLAHLPQELSGGEQQRVAIARAIAHRPEVLFADEPTAELDTNTGLQVVKIFKELAASEGVTIVMTTHDTGLMEIGDVVYQLEDGEFVG